MLDIGRTTCKHPSLAASVAYVNDDWISRGHYGGRERPWYWLPMHVCNVYIHSTGCKL